MSDDLSVLPAVLPGLRERLLAVRSLGILDGLDDNGALLLAEYSKVSSFEPGEEVTGKGREASSVHIVLEGRIKVPRADGSALAIEQGRGVGLIGALSNTQTGFASEAELRTRTLEISKDAFFAALEESFSIARNVLKVFAAMLLDLRSVLPTPTEAGRPVIPFEERTGPRTLVERVLEISHTGIFANANIDSIFDLARVMRQIKVPPGHVFFEPGDPARASIRVLGGTILCTAPGGQEIEISSGYMLGGLIALAGRTHAFQARALTEVVAYEIPFEDFLRILEAHPELTLGLLQDLARSLLEGW